MKDIDLKQLTVLAKVPQLAKFIPWQHLMENYFSVDQCPWMADMADDLGVDHEDLELRTDSPDYNRLQEAIAELDDHSPSRTEKDA